MIQNHLLWYSYSNTGKTSYKYHSSCSAHQCKYVKPMGQNFRKVAYPGQLRGSKMQIKHYMLCFDTFVDQIRRAMVRHRIDMNRDLVYSSGPRMDSKLPKYTPNMSERMSWYVGKALTLRLYNSWNSKIDHRNPSTGHWDSESFQVRMKYDQ